MLRTSARGGKADGLKNKNGRGIPRSFSDVRVVFGKLKKPIVGGNFGTFQIKVDLKSEKAGTSARPILTRRASESRPLPLLAVFSRGGLSPAVAALHPASGRLSATVRGFSSTFFCGSPLPVGFGLVASAGFYPRRSL